MEIEIKKVNKRSTKKMVTGDSFVCKMYNQGKYFSMLPLNTSFKIERLSKDYQVVEHAHQGYWTRFTKN